MLKTKSFLCLDFGAGTLKAAEFDTNEGGTLVLRKFGVRPLGLEGSQDSVRENVLRRGITELTAEKGFTSKRANVCAPGYHVFSKFVKLPAVDSSKVTQIIQYEAQQNVPFPLEEVVWDYQILGTTPTGELEVLLVAIKGDMVEGLFRTAEATGLKLELVDVSPAALCNAFRYNYGDLEGCTMLLDIGAKTSNLLFFEKGKVYSRGLNIGANAITQEFAAEAKLRFAEAEKLKIAEGFVSLGGAYEEPENPHQAAISKIARQVMTRLHIQVNQTIQFYRGQQGGTAPQRLFLAGGASIMAYTAQFFAEKLNVPVEYFNPFRNIEIDPSVNLEELAGVAHGYGEVVGLGLRNIAQCPVELNLVPKSIRKRQALDQKKPYFMAAMFSLILVVFAYGFFYDRLAMVKADSLAKVNQEVEPLKRYETTLQKHEGEIRKIRNEIESFIDFGKQRYFWFDLFSGIRLGLMGIEKKMEQQLGTPVGVWIETFGSAEWNPYRDSGSGYGNPYMNYQQMMMRSMMPYMMDPALAMRYGLIQPGMRMPGMPGMPGMTPPGQGAGQGELGAEGAAEGGGGEGVLDPTKPVKKKDTENQIEEIEVRFRAVNLNRSGNASANGVLAFEVENLMTNNPAFDPAGTKLSSMEQVDDQAVTFSFGVNVKLKEPIQK